MSAEADRAPETGGVEDRLLPWDRVQAIAGISRATAWRMQKAGDFPEPVPISPNRVGWWESELTAWKATRMAGGRARPKPFAPPRAPRLIESARSPRPKATAAVVRESPPRREPEVRVPVQAQLALEGEAPRDPSAVKQGRRRRHVSPDQIDFGF